MFRQDGCCIILKTFSCYQDFSKLVVLAFVCTQGKRLTVVRVTDVAALAQPMMEAILMSPTQSRKSCV